MRNLSLHGLWYIFAGYLLLSGVDLSTVQRLMGHKDLQTTMRYAHLAPNHLKMGMAMLNFSGHYLDTRSSGSNFSLNNNRRKSL